MARLILGTGHAPIEPDLGVPARVVRGIVHGPRVTAREDSAHVAGPHVRALVARSRGAGQLQLVDADPLRRAADASQGKDQRPQVTLHALRLAGDLVPRKGTQHRHGRLSQPRDQHVQDVVNVDILVLIVDCLARGGEAGPLLGATLVVIG